jgi:hypothetical protein
VDDDEQWMVTACLIGLAVCIMLHGAAIWRVRRDVEFLTVIAEKRIDV